MCLSAQSSTLTLWSGRPTALRTQGVRPYESAVVVRIFLIGCAFLLLGVGCAGTRSETSKKKEQGSLPEATTAEEARCEGTGTYHLYDVSYNRGGEGPLRTGSEDDMKKAAKKARQDWRWGVKTHDFGVYTTNDLPGCPLGGLLLGTDKPDKLGGKVGDDEVRGLGGRDDIFGGDGDDEVGGLGGDDDLQGELGDDTIYGGEGNDELESGKGEDVLYGGDGNDILIGAYSLGQRDKLYCGEGKDQYLADNNDYVDSSCEERMRFGGSA
jgi:RTX calcium-binding nonapeptide repeat (4 copies)